MCAKVKKNTSSVFMMECEASLGVNTQVIHVDFQPTLGDHICEDMIHKRLESGLQNPKNMTVGSKSPKGVMNAPFHWSSS